MPLAGNRFGQNGLDPINDPASVETTGEVLLQDAIFAGAFDQVADLEIEPGPKAYVLDFWLHLKSAWSAVWSDSNASADDGCIIRPR
jgi:hypothetical protein